MAFNQQNLLGYVPEQIRYTGQQKVFFWTYYSATDALAVASAPGYFYNALDQLYMALGDLVYIYDATNDAGKLYFISNFTGNGAVLTALTSSGGSGVPKPINSLPYTVGPGDFGNTLVFNVPAGGIVNLIAGTSPGQQIIMVSKVDFNSGASIQVDVVGCTINLASSNSGITGDFGYVTYEWDGVSNWMVVG